MARRLLLPALVTVFALALGACGGGELPASATPAGEAATTSAPATSAVATAAETRAFPVSIRHAFGETVVEAQPRRVVAWGWGSADAAIALGVVPVAIPFQSYGGDKQGVLPWIRKALEERGASIPTMLPNSGEEPPYEEIAAAQPDLILAVYSGITKKQYELLSQIAPTVAYPSDPWATPWRDVVRIVGTALGREAEATRLLEGIDAAVAQRAAAYPELAGKSVAMVWDAGGTFYVYKEADARVSFALGLGLVSAESVARLATDESTFYFTLSYERLDELQSDILVSFADTPELSRAFLESKRAGTMEQVRSGEVAEIVGREFVAAVSPPTALSLTWGLDRYVLLLAEAARRVDAVHG